MKPEKQSLGSALNMDSDPNGKNGISLLQGCVKAAVLESLSRVLNVPRSKIRQREKISTYQKRSRRDYLPDLDIVEVLMDVETAMKQKFPDRVRDLSYLDPEAETIQKGTVYELVRRITEAHQD